MYQLQGYRDKMDLSEICNLYYYLHLLYFQINCRLLLSHRDTNVSRKRMLQRIACRSRWSGGPETAEARIPRKFRNVSARAVSLHAKQKKFRVDIIINKANTARWRRILLPTRSWLTRENVHLSAPSYQSKIDKKKWRKIIWNRDHLLVDFFYP